MDNKPVIRHDWSNEEISILFNFPFPDLIYQAQTIHRRYFAVKMVQMCTLVNIRTGACPEDCAYCAQSIRYKTGLKPQKLMPVAEVIKAAKRAKQAGATRLCLGAAWRNLKDRDMSPITTMIRKIKQLGLQTCVTLGMLTAKQAQQLKQAGLDYYNHNLDTSPEYYKKIITTRTYQDRLQTLKYVRQANIAVCCGGIIGMGENRQDRIGLLKQLATLPAHPKSVPINLLEPIPGTPLANSKKLDAIEFIRMIATARILMPKSFIRLSAGRNSMSDVMQALCFSAGANSIFVGEKLLTVANPQQQHDQELLQRLGLTTMSAKQLTEMEALLA